ncbi:MAG: glycosyl hydrolase [Thermoguttaceae bacterium]
MKRSPIVLVAACLWLGVLGSAALAQQDDFARLERQFRELPMEARRLTGPLFWLHGDETREQLEAEIARVAEGGNGCFTAESRPHKDWLGPGWWRDLGICLEAAKKHNLEMWIFDERWWPSQEIGGRVPAQYAVKRLDATAVDVEGPKEFQANGYSGERYVAAVAGRLVSPKSHEPQSENPNRLDLRFTGPFSAGKKVMTSSRNTPWVTVKKIEFSEKAFDTLDIVWGFAGTAAWDRRIRITVAITTADGRTHALADSERTDVRLVPPQIHGTVMASSGALFRDSFSLPERIKANDVTKITVCWTPLRVDAALDLKIDGDSLVDLAPFIHDGRLAWQAPAGKWRIMKFTHVQGQPLAQTGHLSIDGASKDCVDWYIKTVYQPHYDHFGSEFGKTIRGFFYDEPETRGDWGTELNAVLAERKVDWKKAYVAYKFQLAGEEQTAAKFQYLDAFAETWGRTMYGGIARWCHEHHVKSIGHFMEHGGLYHNKDFCAGDMTRLQRYSDMGAIDAVFTQFIMGKREEGANPPIWQTPKIASSISHVFGKQDDIAMVEIFGARGQDLSYREMKWWTDHMQVSGVNFLIPHSFNPRAPYDDDCPPYFYNGGFEPRWPLYRVFADYTSRLSLMLTGGRHVCPVAILFNGNLGQVGKMVPPDKISAALQDAQLDCDWLPMDVFEREAIIKPRPAVAPNTEPQPAVATDAKPRPAVAGAEIQLHGERYRVLIVPPVEVISYATLAKVKDFFDKGGIVLGDYPFPSKSATMGKTSADIGAICYGIWNEAAHARAVTIRTENGGYSGPTHYITRRLEGQAGARRAFRIVHDYDGWLHVLHRHKAGGDIFLVANQKHQGAARKYTFCVTARGEPECWDPMRNEVTRPRFERIDASTVQLSLMLEPLETVLLVFQPKKTARPARIEPWTKPIREPIAIVREANPPSNPPTPDMKRKPLTLSPVKAADPFRGRVTIPADVDLAHCRVYLQMDDLPGEAAAVTVNSQRAGGLIGRPLRLDITRHLKSGENTILIEPLAPKAARLVFYSDK